MSAAWSCPALLTISGAIYKGLPQSDVARLSSGTLAFCRDALQGGKAAQDAATKLVKLIVRDLKASRNSQVATWQNRTRAGVKKEGRSKTVK